MTDTAVSAVPPPARPAAPHSEAVQWVLDAYRLRRAETHRANLEKLLEDVRRDSLQEHRADMKVAERAASRARLKMRPEPPPSRHIRAARKVRFAQLEASEQRLMQMVTKACAHIETLKLAPAMRAHTSVVVATPDIDHALDAFATSLKEVSAQQDAQRVKIDGAFDAARSAEDQAIYDYEQQLEETAEIVALAQQLSRATLPAQPAAEPVRAPVKK